MVIPFNVISNKLLNSKRDFFLFVVLVKFSVSLCSTYGQSYPVAIFITVVPPYTSRIDDYISQPDKVIVTITSLQDRMIYIAGKLIELKDGEENPDGISVFTNPERKVLVQIRKGTHRISLKDIPVFDASNLVYQGISKNSLLYKGGLPEGDYRICLQAFDNLDPTEPVSAGCPQGCSNVMMVRNLEPPVILQPAVDAEINATNPQLITFVWTRPPGAPVSTQFKLIIVEVLPAFRNANDAFQSAAYPVFFEKIVNLNFYQYGPSDPALIPGKRYAFIVTAIDPMNQVRFRNNGKSEVSSFSYGNNQSFEYTFTGKIFWSFLDRATRDDESYPLQFCQVELVLTCLGDSVGKSFGAMRVGSGTTDQDGNFAITFRGELKNQYQAKLSVNSPYFFLPDSSINKPLFNLEVPNKDRADIIDLGQFLANASVYSLKPVLLDSTGVFIHPNRICILRPSGFYGLNKQFRSLIHEIDITDTTRLDLAFNSVTPIVNYEEQQSFICITKNLFLTSPIVVQEINSAGIFTGLFYSQFCEDRYIILFWFDKYENYAFYLDIKIPYTGIPGQQKQIVEKSFFVR